MATNPNLKITISAVDKTSAAIDAVAKKLGGIEKPADKATKSVSRLSAVSGGVKRLSEAVHDLGRSAAGSGLRVADALAPLSGLTAALTVGGAVRATSDWAQFSRGLANDAKRIGVSAGDLQTFQTAASLSGTSAEAAGAGIRTLQDTMTDAVDGRDMEALVYFRNLGVAIDDGHRNALRATEVMPRLFDALSRIKDPSRQFRAASKFFGGATEAMLPFIRRGAQGYAEMTAKARDYNTETAESTARAEKFAQAQSGVSSAFEALRNRISYEVSPALTNVMTAMDKWILKNKDMIALDVAGWAKDYTAIFGGIGTAIDTVVTNTIGWNRALEFGIPLIAARAIPSLARLENMLLKLTVLRLPQWLLTLLTGPAGGVDPEFSEKMNDDYLLKNRVPHLVVGPHGMTTENYRPSPTQAHPWEWLKKKLGFGGDTRPPVPTVPLSGPGRLGNPLPTDIEREVRQQARLKGLDEEHMVRLARVEAGGYDRVSSAGAMGPMQLMPDTADDLKVNPRDWHQNIEGGSRLYRQLLDRFHGNYRAADAAYNAGPNRESVAHFAATGDMSRLPTETRNYVNNINGTPLQPPAATPPVPATPPAGDIKATPKSPSDSLADVMRRLRHDHPSAAPADRPVPETKQSSTSVDGVTDRPSRDDPSTVPTRQAQPIPGRLAMADNTGPRSWAAWPDIHQTPRGDTPPGEALPAPTPAAVKVDINIKGLPHGATAVTRSSGDAVPGVRIHRAMA